MEQILMWAMKNARNINLILNAFGSKKERSGSLSSVIVFVQSLSRFRLTDHETERQSFPLD